MNLPNRFVQVNAYIINKDEIAVIRPVSNSEDYLKKMYPDKSQNTIKGLEQT